MPFDIGGQVYRANSAYSTLDESVVQQGLVLHLNAGVNHSYPGSGNTVYDTSQYNHHGTFVDNTSYATTNGGSFVFDGSGDYINGVHNSIVNITGDLTCEAWFKVTSEPSDWVRIFGKGNASLRTYGLWYNPAFSGGKYFLFQRAGNVLYNINYSSNTWYHIAGTSIGSEHKMYVNGVEVANNSWGVADSVTEAYTVGYGLVHTYHNGLISTVRLYNRGLDGGEIAINFNCERTRHGV